MQSDLLANAVRRRRRTTTCTALGNADHVVVKRHHIIMALSAIVLDAWGNEYDNDNME